MKFEYWKANNGNWYFRLKASNGEIVAQSEGYVNESDCLNTINKIKAGASTATVVKL